MLLAYIGPDTLLPLTSVLAALVGCAMMCGRGVFVVSARVLRSVAKVSGRFLGRNAPAARQDWPRIVRTDRRQDEWRGPRRSRQDAGSAAGRDDAQQSSPAV